MTPWWSMLAAACGTFLVFMGHPGVGCTVLGLSAIGAGANGFCTLYLEDKRADRVGGVLAEVHRAIEESMGEPLPEDDDHPDNITPFPPPEA